MDTELQQINATLKRLAREQRRDIPLVGYLQRRRMEIINGMGWQAKLAAWIHSGEEFKGARAA
jgi:hypothetical protein